MIQEQRGRGTLLLDDKEVLAGEFEVSHDLNQSNGLVLIFEAASNAAVTFETRMASGERDVLERRLALRGETDDGILVRVNRLLMANRDLSQEVGQPMQTVLRLLPCTFVHIGAPLDEASLFRFSCPNLLFDGFVMTEQADGSHRRDTVSVDASRDGRRLSFRLKQLPDYKEGAETVQQTTRSRWTATLEVQTDDGSTLEVDEASSLADDFLLLLSFALSRRATWVSLEASDDSGSFQRIRSGTATNLKSFPGSVMRGGRLTGGASGLRQPLSEFMGSALPAYWGLERHEQERLQEAIECMCESIERFFSPATITLVGRAFETLCHRFLSKAEQAYLSRDSEQDRNLKATLHADLDAFASQWATKEKIMAEEWSERVDGHMSNILRRPFKLQLQSLLDRWLLQTRNKYDSTWPPQFVDARNCAAHYSSVGQKEYNAWVKGITLLSQVILKILGYSGPYGSFYRDGKSESKWSAMK